MTIAKLMRVVAEPHRGGYDVTAEMTDGLRTSAVTFFVPKRGETVPDAKNLATKLAAFCDKFDEPAPAEEKVYAESEIVALLVQKKYLQEGQKLADLPVKAASEGVK
jgi:hypothetical protein